MVKGVGDSEVRLNLRRLKLGLGLVQSASPFSLAYSLAPCRLLESTKDLNCSQI
jgi:hypothetical protein